METVVNITLWDKKVAVIAWNKKTKTNYRKIKKYSK